MSLPTALRPVVLALTAVGSLVPGATVAPAGTTPGLPVVSAGEAARVSGPDPASLRRTWSWPLSPRPAVVAPFVAPRSTYGAGHRGIDLAAAQGQRVTSVAAGVVTHVGVVAGRGTVSIIHPTGLRSTYEPVRGVVRAGAVVAQGQVVGVVEGRTHCGGACLHLGALVGSVYLDPRPLLGGGPVILLPLADGR